MQEYTFTMLFERSGDWILISCPTLPGCNSQAANDEEAIVNAQAALLKMLSGFCQRGEKIPLDAGYSGRILTGGYTKNITVSV